MLTLEEIARDDHGFLSDPQQWSPEIGRELAATLGMEPLTPDHLRVIEFLRQHYLGAGAVPPAEEACLGAGLQQHCIRELFRDYKAAWMVAGLPNPGLQLREFMEDDG